MILYITSRKNNMDNTKKRNDNLKVINTNLEKTKDELYEYLKNEYLKGSNGNKSIKEALKNTLDLNNSTENKIDSELTKNFINQLTINLKNKQEKNVNEEILQTVTIVDSDQSYISENYDEYEMKKKLYIQLIKDIITT